MASELFKENIDKTSSGYKVILSYLSTNDLTGESNTKYAEVDVQEDGLDVKSNVELTSYPTLQGHHISDHIYRLPIEVSIKGEFADNGLKSFGWIGEDRLTRIQSEFEACQRAGVKFRLVTIRNNDAADKSNWRFLARQNMVLTGISWQQHQHSLSFSFNFKEAISSNLQIVETKKDLTDPNLPAITDLSAASLVGELISTNDVITMTIEALRNLNLVNDATFNRCAATAKNMIGLSVAAIVLTKVIITKILASLTIASASIPIVGWIVGAAIAITAAIIAVFNINNAIERAKQLAYYRQLGHVFLIEDDMSEDEKDKVVQNFVAFLATVNNAVDEELSDISIFRIAKADRQECTLNVNGTYYVQRIEKNDDDLSYRIESLYLGKTPVASRSKIIALESFNDCNESSAFFFDKFGVEGSTYRVYIINRSAYKQELLNEETDEDKLQQYKTTDIEKYNAEKENLLNYAFVVSKQSLTNLTDRITDVIKKVIG